MRARALLCIPVVLLLAAEARAQCRIEGVVLALSGKPLAGATVRVEGPDLKPALMTVTDASGQYVVENVKPGIRVRLVVSLSGRPITEAYTLVTLKVERVDMREEGIAPSAATRPEDVLAEDGPSVDIDGLVKTADGLRTATARVTLNQTALTTTTDASGRFAFGGLRPGIPVELTAVAAGYRRTSQAVDIPLKGRVAVELVLEAEPAGETTPTGLSLSDTTSDAGRVTAWPEQASLLPTLGANDVFRALQFQPGVAGTREASSELFVRGGTPGQTLITWDGMTLYPMSRPFGRHSGFNAHMIQQADLTVGPTGAADGGRLSGALRLTGPSNTTGRPSAFVEVSLLGAGGFVSLPIGSRGSLSIAARRSPPASLYSRALNHLTGQDTVWARDRVPRYSGGTLPFSADTSFYDVNGRLDLKLTGADRLTVSVYDAVDQANASRDLAFDASATGFHVPESNPLPSDTVVQFSDVSIWKGRGMSAAWTRRWSPSASSTVSLARSEFTRDAAWAAVFTSPSTGIDYSFTAGRGGSGAWADHNRIRDLTLRIDSLVGLGTDHALSVGGEVANLETDYTIRREALRTSGTGGALTSSLENLFVRSESARVVTAYAEDTWRPIGALSLAPGLRVTHYDLAGSTYVEPRLRATYQLRPQVRLSGGWSFDHQVIDRIAREERSQEDGQFWMLANGGSIPVARAQHFTLGAKVEVPGFLLRVDAYHRSLDDLTLFAPRLFPGIAPTSSTTLLHHGSGTAQGIEGVLQVKSSNGNTFWISYIGSRTEYTYPTLESAAFPASHDQSHEFKLADTARLRGNWSIGAVWVIGSGQPFTQAESVLPVWLPGSLTVYQPDYKAKNGTRLTAYHRLDLTLQRELRVGRLRGAIGATIFNVYDMENILYTGYETAGTNLKFADMMLMRRSFNAFLRVGF